MPTTLEEVDRKTSDTLGVIFDRLESGVFSSEQAGAAVEMVWNCVSGMITLETSELISEMITAAGSVTFSESVYLKDGKVISLVRDSDSVRLVPYNIEGQEPKVVYQGDDVNEVIGKYSDMQTSLETKGWGLICQK